MPQQANDTVAAQISAYDNGQLYVPIKARDMLNLGYNDEVEVKIPEFGGRDADATVRGFLQSSGQIQAGQGLTDHLVGEDGRTAHVEAEIQPTGSEWGENRPGTDKRWKRVRHLIAELL